MTKKTNKSTNFSMAQNNAYLLDTQIFLWWMTNDQRLTSKIKKILSDPHRLIYLSVASVWEIIIKQQIGKLTLPHNLLLTIKNCGFDLLAIELEHALEIQNLPDYHKDPFDRLLIAQAISEKLTLITSDAKIWKYQLNVHKLK